MTIQLSRTDARAWLARARDFANTRAQEADIAPIKLLAESYSLILEAKKIIAKIAGNDEPADLGPDPGRAVRADRPGRALADQDAE